VTTVPERVSNTETFICGFCEEPFTLNPDDNHCTATERADDYCTAVTESVCVKTEISVRCVPGGWVVAPHNMGIYFRRAEYDKTAVEAKLFGGL
jgi:hypothetical protein